MTTTRRCASCGKTTTNPREYHWFVVDRLDAYDHPEWYCSIECMHNWMHFWHTKPTESIVGWQTMQRIQKSGQN